MYRTLTRKMNTKETEKSLSNQISRLLNFSVAFCDFKSSCIQLLFVDLLDGCCTHVDMMRSTCWLPGITKDFHLTAEEVSRIGDTEEYYFCFRLVNRKCNSSFRCFSVICCMEADRTHQFIEKFCFLNMINGS